MSYNCLECSEGFFSERSLHAHIKKHGVFLHDYYVKHFERKNLLTNELLPFKNKESYFKRDFHTIDQLYHWCELYNKENVRNYTKSLLKQRITECELTNAPNEIELFTSFLPSLNIYRNLFKSYNYLCDSLNIKPLFSEKLPSNFWENEKVHDLKIITDTREQEPLYFKKQIVGKLDIGDYGIVDGFDYTFVDRKSEQDFKGTLSLANLDRFEKELIRTRSLNCYLFIVIEADLYSLEDQNKKSYHKSNMKYIFHNMRILQHKYKDCAQFVFTGSRTNSENLIPLLLHWGKKVWNVDMQHFINQKYGLGFRTAKK